MPEASAVVLLDQNVPKGIKSWCGEFGAATAFERGWAELRNRELLAKAEAHGFRVLVTGDKNLPHQQSLRDGGISVVILPVNNWPQLKDLCAQVLDAIREAVLSAGTIRIVETRNGASSPNGRLNPLVAAVAAPPIPEVRAWAGLYDGRHGPVLDLTQAVPGYPPHPDLVRHLADASRDPESFAYGPITGDDDLRAAFARDVSELYGGEVSPAEVAITTGANMGSFAVTLTLAKAGDAVMLPVPWYFNHQMNAEMLGVEVVPLPCRPETGFVPDAAEAESLLRPNVRAIMLVTPNNPTGAVYPPATIAAFADLCRRRGLTLVLDETYRDFRPLDLPRPHELFADPSWRDTVIQLYSFSKSYCVPGYRLGAVVAAEPFLAQFTKILDCVQICAARVGQAGLAWAIPALTEWRDGNRALMNARGDACRAAFAAEPSWVLDSHGSYFAYLRHPFAGASSWEVAKALAVEWGVLTLPGEAFGPGQALHLRLAFANVDEPAIREAVRRLAGLRLGA